MSALYTSPSLAYEARLGARKLFLDTMDDENEFEFMQILLVRKTECYV